MNILKLTKTEKKDITEFYLKKLWGKDYQNFLDKPSLIDDIEVSHLNEGDIVGPWNKGDEKKVWFIKSGSLRPFLKIDQFKNEISIEKCPQGKFIGLYENLCNWNYSYYLACDKEVELIGMPFENLLELLKFSKSDYPFNNAFENQLFFEKSLLINTLFKNLNNKDFIQNKKEILQFNEYEFRVYLNKITKGIKEVQTSSDIKNFFKIVENNSADDTLFFFNKLGMFINDSTKKSKSEETPIQNFDNLEIAINKSALKNLISKIDKIQVFKQEKYLNAKQEDNSLKSEIEFQSKSNEESELLFGKSLLEISNSIKKCKQYDDPEIYKSMIKGILDFYLIDYSKHTINEKINELLDKTTDYRLGLLDKDEQEAMEERQKLNRWIITKLLEEINISSNNYDANLNDPLELSFPIILLDEFSFPVIIWERNQSKFLTSYTNKNKENDKKQFLEKLSNEKKEEIRIIDASTRKEPTKDENTKVMDLIMPFLKKYKSELILVVVASFVAQMLTVSVPLIIQKIVDSVISQGNIRALGVFGSSLIIIVILEGLISISRTIIFSRTANLIDIGVGMQVIDKLLTLPFSYFSKRNVGETTSRINEVENIRSFLTGSGLTVILDAIFIVIYIAIMVSYSLPLTLVTLSIIPLIGLITIFISPIIRRLLRQQAIENAKVQSHLVESLSAIETIKAEQFERNVINNWRKNYRKEVGLGYKKDVVSVTAGNVSEFIEQLSGLIAIWYGAYLVINAKLTVGQLFAFRILSGYVTGPIVRLSSVWQNIQEALLSFYRLSDILKRNSESYEDHLLETASSTIKNITFKNVDFTYSDKNKLNLVLHSLSFDSTNHKLLSIVGQSGSGKSSILKLISKLYEPTAGQIFVDGININRLSTYSLRKGIAHVTQDSILFDGSIEENMRVSDLPVSKETINWALEMACCDQFISLLEYGINTSVGERGQLLSGGQRQRIAIARAIMHKPSILLLDEATSALDVATEFNLFNNLKKELPNTSIISVSHKLSSVAKFSDHILVLDKGYLVEQGSHEDLIKKNKFYANLLSSQIKNYE